MTFSDSIKDFKNYEQIEKSEKCGCFSCCEIFTPSEITDYIPDEPPTAECPFCHTDSVIGDASGFPITKDFLKKMKKRWFYGDFQCFHLSSSPISWGQYQF
nr:cytoplasmic protein [uncultured Prevotella sp.]